MYDRDFIVNTFTNLGPPNEYSFDVQKLEERTLGGDWNSPPVRVLINFATDISNEEKQEEIARYSVLNRKIDFYVRTNKKNLEGISELSEPTHIGTIQFNSTSFAWDDYELIRNHPLALKSLIETITAYHLKNLFPSQS